MRAMMARKGEFDILAINDLGDAETNAHLTQYDTAHGRFPHPVAVEDGDLMVKGDRIKVLAERDPAKLPWGALGVDVVLECTGLFTSKAKAGAPGPPFRYLYPQPTAKSAPQAWRSTGSAPTECDRSHSTSDSKIG